MAAGVPTSKVYPIDVKLAFAKLADLKPHMTWWQSGAQFAQLYADEEVVLGYGWGARVVVLARDGKPLAVELNQAILDQSFLAVSKISRNKEAAMKFLAFATQPKPQAERPLLYPHGPTNKKAWAQLDAKTTQGCRELRSLRRPAAQSGVVDGQRNRAARGMEEIPGGVRPGRRGAR